MINKFTIRQAADADLRGKTDRQTALNAEKNGMSRKTVSQRDAERRGMAENNTVSIAEI